MKLSDFYNLYKINMFLEVLIPKQCTLHVLLKMADFTFETHEKSIRFYAAMHGSYEYMRSEVLMKNVSIDFLEQKDSPKSYN